MTSECSLHSSLIPTACLLWQPWAAKAFLAENEIPGILIHLKEGVSTALCKGCQGSYRVDSLLWLRSLSLFSFTSLLTIFLIIWFIVCVYVYACLYMYMWSHMHIHMGAFKFHFLWEILLALFLRQLLLVAQSFPEWTGLSAIKPQGSSASTSPLVRSWCHFNIWIFLF